MESLSNSAKQAKKSKHSIESLLGINENDGEKPRIKASKEKKRKRHSMSMQQENGKETLTQIK